MEKQDIDKAQLKAIIKEVLAEDPALVKSVIKEVLLENQIIVSDEQGERRASIEKMINEDFDQYGEVFKSLA